MATGAKESMVSRAGVNSGLKYAWGVIRNLKDDPDWLSKNKTDAKEWIRLASFHRDTVWDLLTQAGILKAGVAAAQITNMVVSAPQLLKSGGAVLKSLAAWLQEGGGGTGMLAAAGAGGGGLVLMSGGRTLVLTLEQVKALVQAGQVSASALGLYTLAVGQGTGGGQPSIRPPKGVKRTPEVVRKFQGDSPFDAYNKARADAIKQAGVKDTIPFYQECGPHTGRVTGGMAGDGSRGWRLDFDPQSSKGFHINWWRWERGVYEAGANVVKALPSMITMNWCSTSRDPMTPVGEWPGIKDLIESGVLSPTAADVAREFAGFLESRYLFIRSRAIRSPGGARSRKPAPALGHGHPRPRRS